MTADQEAQQKFEEQVRDDLMRIPNRKVGNHRRGARACQWCRAAKVDVGPLSVCLRCDRPGTASVPVGVSA